MATETRVTQDAVELLTWPVSPEARVTQDAVELLTSTAAPPVGAALAVSASLGLSTIGALTVPAIAHLAATATLSLAAIGTVTIPVGPGLVTQLAVELLDAQPPALAISQLVVETLNPLLRSPINTTHALAELLGADPNLALITAFACELLVIGAPHECLTSHTPLPIDPD